MLLTNPWLVSRLPRTVSVFIIIADQDTFSGLADQDPGAVGIVVTKNVLKAVCS